MAKFGYVLNIPKSSVSDVATHELTITVNGAEPPLVKAFPVGTEKTDQLVFDVNDEVSVTLVDIDGSGNRSPASAALSFKVIDDVAPPVPGELSVAEKVQID